MSPNYTASFGDVTLTVTPDKMFQTADSIEKRISSSKQLFAQMIEIVEKTSEYWDGVVADQERSNFANENENFEALIMNLNNYVSELRAMTSLYEITEEGQTQLAQDLPSGILD